MNDLRELTRRRHVDLVRVSSSLCLRRPVLAASAPVSA
ncbi:putative leader peptide [Streptomyces sp. NPDC093109]